MEDSVEKLTPIAKACKLDKEQRPRDSRDPRRSNRRFTSANRAIPTSCHANTICAACTIRSAAAVSACSRPSELVW